MVYMVIIDGSNILERKKDDDGDSNIDFILTMMVTIMKIVILMILMILIFWLC